MLTAGGVQRPFFDRLMLFVFDTYQRILPRVETGAPLAVIDIDEASIAKLGQWPWPRTAMADLVDRIGALGAVTIAFDLVFSEPDRTSMEQQAEALRRGGADVTLPPGVTASNDMLLAQAIGRNSVTLGIAISNETSNVLPAPKSGISFAGADPKTYLADFHGGLANLPELTAAASGMGSFSFPTATDGVVRTIPLVFSSGGNLYPALGVEALRLAQGAGTLIVRSTGASGEADTGQPAMVAVRDGALDIPTGASGDFWIYYSGLPSMPVVSAADILGDNAQAIADKIAGRIVLIGTSAVGLRDLVTTPTGRGVPGVRVHAEIIDQIVGQVFLTRPDWAPGLELAGAGLAGFVLLLVAAGGRAFSTSAAALILIAAAAATSWWAFAENHLLFDPLLPSFTVILIFAVVTPILLLLTDRDRLFVRNAFGRYLSPTMVERLAADPQALALGGEIRQLTVLFSDIRGFTSLSEGMNPQELTSLLNDFLTPMTDILLARESTIDKYMGDAIMAFWNAPLDIADHERKGCLAALAMTAELEQLNVGRTKPLRIGIGLNTDDCCVGNLGSAQRFSYSAIGDGVNVASRVEGLTKSYGVSILVTELTRRAAPELAFVEVDLVRVVGRAQPLPVFALLGDASRAATETFMLLLGDHRRMIAAYRAADPEMAGAALARCRGHGLPELDYLYQLYEDRIAALVTDPPPAGWDGVFVSRQK